MRLRGFVITLVTLWSLLAVGGQARGQESQPATQVRDPESVIRAQYAAIDAGDADASVAGFAEQAVVVALPPPPDSNGVFIGKEAIRAKNTQLVARHFHAEFTDFDVHGDNASFTVLLVEDVFRDAGVYPVKFSGTAVVQDGLIQSETWIMSKESLAQLEAAFTRQQNRAVVERLYEEVFNQKNLSLIDELYASNVVDHDRGDNSAEEVGAKLAGLFTGFPDLQVTADLWASEGDLVITRVTLSGTHQGEFAGVAPTGNPMTETHIDIHRVQNGKITDIWHTIPDAEVLQQIGYELVPPAE
jgi:predicted ester cyclase